MESSTYPPEVSETISKIVELTSIPPETIRNEYTEILEEVKKTFPEFKEDESQHKYAVGILWARYRARGPTKEVSVIPVGFDGVRLRKNGEKHSKLYVITLPKGEKKMVFLSGPEAEMYKTITLGAKYTVRLMEFKSGHFGADNRTRFVNPEMTKVDIMSLYRKLKVYEFENLAAVPTMPSRVQKTSTGEFTDSLDWRIVKGIITRMNTGTRKDGVTQYGVINLSDTSLGQEETVDAQGNVISPTFSVWCDPALMNWGVESEVYCIGTVSFGKAKKSENDQNPQDEAPRTVSMNAINIVPSRGIPVTK
jgi:hypothetical protein